MSGADGSVVKESVVKEAASSRRGRSRGYFADPDGCLRKAATQS